jgi:hypothetical protein
MADFGVATRVSTYSKLNNPRPQTITPQQHGKAMLPDFALSLDTCQKKLNFLFVLLDYSRA